MNINREDFESRIAHLIKVIEENPNQSAFISLAHLYIDIDDFAKAIELLKTVEREYPDFSEILLEIAFIYRKSGQYAIAKDNINKFLSIDKHNLPALLEYGELLVDLKKPDEEVLKHYEKVMEIYPDNIEIADKIQRLKKTVESGDDKEEENTPSLSLIKLYWKQGFLIKAKELCEECIRDNPDDKFVIEIYNVISDQIDEQKSSSGDVSFEIPQPIDIKGDGNFTYEELEINPALTKSMEIESYQLSSALNMDNLTVDEFGIPSYNTDDEKLNVGDYEFVLTLTPPFFKISGDVKFNKFDIKRSIKDTVSLGIEEKTMEEDKDKESFQDWLDELIEG